MLKANVKILTNAFVTAQYGDSFVPKVMMGAAAPDNNTCQVSFSTKSKAFL